VAGNQTALLSQEGSTTEGVRGVVPEPIQFGFGTTPLRLRLSVPS